MEKFISSKTMLKMAGGGLHTQYTPHPPWIRPWFSAAIRQTGLEKRKIL